MLGSTRPHPNRATTRFLTTQDAADRLGVSVNSVKSWIRTAQLEALRTPGGHHRIPEDALAAFRARLVEGSRQRPRVARPRVLLADDDRRLLEALAAALRPSGTEGLPALVVEVAADGYEALVQVGAFRPDLLVLDLRMPRLDGFEVCQRLRARPATRHLRILTMTAFTDETARERALAAGADDFLPKPFGLDTFRGRVEALCRPVARR